MIRSHLRRLNSHHQAGLGNPRKGGSGVVLNWILERKSRSARRRQEAKSGTSTEMLSTSTSRIGTGIATNLRRQITRSPSSVVGTVEPHDISRFASRASCQTMNEGL